MELCIKGCGNIWESRELLEVLESIFGANILVLNTVSSIDDIALQRRIERKVKAKLLI